MKKIVILSLFLAITTSVFAQKEVRKQLKAGNKEYKQEKFTESEISYRKALEANAESVDAAYNLGNALYKQGKFPEAMQQYQTVATIETDSEKLASAYHNIGNIFMSQQDYAKSIAAYKQSLLKNPTDHETRYNLALAQKLLQDQEQEQDQDKDKDQDQDQDEQDQQDKQDQQDQDKQDQQDQNKEDKTQEEQQQEERMSEDNAQQILDALLQNEKDTQEKVKEAQMRQMKTRQTDKDW